ncbi:MAG: heavy metal translocating P-type ATPase [Hahellaceae bacterium]|nr:heavy metal translocating P-type ATPase [Hahellaceae bacterium]MCP5212845.1 heavy metal translocating P-type ATPase [Hahellaceae bacterium]
MTTTNCYHCGAIIPENVVIAFNHNGIECSFCCHGCEAVAHSILASNLDTYYIQRSENAITPKTISAQAEAELRLFDRGDIAEDYITFSKSTDKTTQASVELFIEGITCAACIWLIEKHLSRQPGVISIHINHSNQRANLTWQPDQIKFSELLLEISRIGYSAKPFIFDELQKYQAKEKKQAILRIGLAGIGTMQNMMLAVPLYIGASSGITDEFQMFFRWVSLLIATPVVFYSARPFFKAAIRDFKTRHLTMDVPVSIAIFIAYLASAIVTVSGGKDVYFDSVCMFTFFLLIGRYLEMNTRFKASEGLKRLNTLLPTSASLVALDGTESTVPIKDLVPGNRVMVRAGDNIPCDGQVLDGSSSVDESALTGEFFPVAKTINANVTAGTTNIDSPLLIEVARTGKDTRIASILTLMQAAMTNKGSVAVAADRVAAYFVAFILFSATAVGTFWYINDPASAFDIVLAVLVVTCPCALSLATPTALTAAMDKMRTEGILVLRSHVIDALAKASHVYLDKTGTLTEGRLKIVKTTLFNVTTEERAFSLASALESTSKHPIASAFRRYTPTHASTTPDKKETQVFLTHIKHTPGRGIEAMLLAQEHSQAAIESIRIGSRRYVEEIIKNRAMLPDETTTTLYLAGSVSGLMAAFEVTDKIRDSAPAMLQQCADLNIKTTLLSGDNLASVTSIAHTLNIQDIVANASPEDKLRHIRDQQSSVTQSVMVGDGINDLPVMAAADISIAMANAADINKINADAVMLRNDLTLVPRAIVLSQKTQRIIVMNLAWAFAYNATALPLAACGLIPPFLAAAGMSISSMVVVLNSLRIKKG